MIRKIIHTIGVRYIVALFNFALIIINAKILGLDGVGIAGVVIASLNMVVVLSSLLCGNTIVYFLNKYSDFEVLLPSYVFALLSSIVGSVVLYGFNLVPPGFSLDIFFLSLLNAGVAINSRFLLAKNKVELFNLVFFLQGGSVFFFVLLFYFGLSLVSVSSYIYSFYFSNVLAYIVSLYYVYKYVSMSESSLESLSKKVREMLAYGLWSGVDNIAENCTARLNYFLLQYYSGGVSSIGLLDSGTRISESVSHISRSVAFLSYGEVTRSADNNAQKIVTLNLFKATFVALLFVMGLIVCIPEYFFTDYLFSEEFKGIRAVVLSLSFGIVAWGSNSILVHYFIGTGKVRISTYCSLLGLSVLLLFGVFLIPAYGAVGAALSSSFAFCGMLLYSLVMFSSITCTRTSEYLINKEDVSLLWERISPLLTRKKKKG